MTLLVPPHVEVATPAGPSPRVLWRRVWQRTLLVPLVVLAPLVALAPTADHRFNLYWHGGLFRDDPLPIVPHTLRSIPTYLHLGNFRPLGRMLEKALDLAAYALTDVFGVPVNITFRLVSFAAAIMLTGSAVLLAESVVAHGRVPGRAPSTLAATVPFAVGGGFVAAGSASPAVLFGGLYFLSAALVFAVGAAACRWSRRIGWWRGGLLILAGAALASFNEIAYLAPPFAVVTVAIRQRWILRHDWRTVRTGPPACATGLMWLGFLPVFVAVRLVIRGYCATGGCYRGSDISWGTGLAAAVPARAIAWLPPLMWHSANPGAWRVGAIAVLAALVLGWLAVRAIRDLRWLTPVGRSGARGTAVVALALLALGATLGALNADVQALAARHEWGLGWRDTAVTAAAGAVLLAAVPHALDRRMVPAAVVLLALIPVVSAVANDVFRNRLAARPPALLANRIAEEMADVDPGPAGNARRCALRTEFRTLYAGSAFSLRRFDQSLNVATEQRAGVPFCAAPR